MPSTDSDRLSIAVSGSSGFVGRHLVSEASRRGISVQAFSRTPGAVPSGGNIRVVGLQEDGSNYSEWQGKVEVFVHLAGRAHVLKESALDPREEFRKANVINAIQAANQAFKNGVRRFIYVSSIGVHGTSCNDGPLLSASRLCPDADYAISKLEAEKQLQDFAREHKWDVVIVRPPLIYGPELKGNLLRLMKLANSPVPLPLAGINNKRSFLGIWNFIDFILYAARSDVVSNRTFIPVDREVISTSMLVTQMRNNFGRKAHLFTVPLAPTRIACRLLGQSRLFKQLFESLWVDYRGLHQESGWEPPYSQIEQLTRTVEWFLERNQQ